MALVSRIGPPLALMALIFFFSAQENLNSGLGVWDTIGRKIIHMAEYGLLGSCGGARSGSSTRGRRS